MYINQTFPFSVFGMASILCKISPKAFTEVEVAVEMFMEIYDRK